MDEDSYQNAIRTQHSGPKQKNRPSRPAAVGVGVIGVLLLTVTTGLCVYYTFKLGQERESLQSDCSAIEKLLNDYHALKEEKDTLLKNYRALRLEKDRLQSNNSALTTEKDQLQRNYNTLTQERDRLRNNLPCPEGWSLLGKCYYMPPFSQSWTEARSTCQGVGADLVTIDSREEQAFITQLNSNAWGWIGLQKYGSNWKWVDGTLPNLRYWTPGQPNGGANENCAMTGWPDAGGNPMLTWQDYPCSSPFRPICEKQAN